MRLSARPSVIDLRQVVSTPDPRQRQAISISGFHQQGDPVIEFLLAKTARAETSLRDALTAQSVLTDFLVPLLGRVEGRGVFSR